MDQRMILVGITTGNKMEGAERCLSEPRGSLQLGTGNQEVPCTREAETGESL